MKHLYRISDPAEKGVKHLVFASSPQAIANHFCGILRGEELFFPWSVFTPTDRWQEEEPRRAMSFKIGNLELSKCYDPKAPSDGVTLRLEDLGEVPEIN